jgi:hypothetical protein
MGLPILEGLTSVLGDRLVTVASQLHAIALLALVLAWFWPLLAEMLRRLPKSEPEVEWVQLWRCPQCSTFNRRTFIICTHCDYHLELGGLAKWIPLKLSENFKGASQRFKNSYSMIGWLIYYAITIYAFWKLRFYSFKQDPLPELTASILIFFLLASLLFFRRVFRPQLKSPIAIIMDAISGGVTGALCAVFALLWMATFSWPDKPLAHVQFLIDGQVQVEEAGGDKVRFKPLISQGRQFQVHYMTVTWPLFGIRHITLNRIAGKALKPAWTLTFLEGVAPLLQGESYFRPRIARLSQTLQGAPNANYSLYELQPSADLVLRKKA